MPLLGSGLIKAARSALHADTVNWRDRVVSAGGTVPTGNLNAVDTAVRYAYNNGLRDSGGSNHKIKYLLAYTAAGAFTGFNVPIWDDGVGNASNNGYVSGNWSSGGLVGAATGRYLNTNWNPVTQGVSSSNVSLFAWFTSRNASTSYISWGCFNTTTSFGLLIYTNNTDLVAYTFTDVGSPQSVLANQTASGLYLANRTSASNGRILVNNSLIISDAISRSLTVPNLSMYVGNRNDSGSTVAYGVNGTMFFDGFGTGLTTTEETNLYTMLNNLKTGLGA